MQETVPTFLTFDWVACFFCAALLKGIKFVRSGVDFSPKNVQNVMPKCYQHQKHFRGIFRICFRMFEMHRGETEFSAVPQIDVFCEALFPRKKISFFNGK